MNKSIRLLPIGATVLTACLSLPAVAGNVGPLDLSVQQELSALAQLSGFATLPKGSVFGIVSELPFVAQDFFVGGVNAFSALPGLSKLGGQSGSSNPLASLQRSSAVAALVAPVIVDLPALAPLVVSSVITDGPGILQAK